MNSTIVSKRLNEQIRPFLKAEGFTKFTSRNAWRTRPNVIEVINFQSFNSYMADGLGCTTYSFGVNLGIYYLPVHNNPWITVSSPDFPKEYSCQARLSLTKTLAQPEFPRPDIWYVNEWGLALDDVVTDAKQAIAEQGLRWFDKMSDLNYALAAFQDKPETFIQKSIAIEILGGRPGSLARLEVVSGIALEMGRIDVAKSYIEQVMSNPFYARWGETIQMLKERLSMIEVQDARRGPPFGM